MLYRLSVVLAALAALFTFWMGMLGGLYWWAALMMAVLFAGPILLLGGALQWVVSGGKTREERQREWLDMARADILKDATPRSQE